MSSDNDSNSDCGTAEYPSVTQAFQSLRHYQNQDTVSRIIPASRFSTRTTGGPDWSRRPPPIPTSYADVCAQYNHTPMKRPITEIILELNAPEFLIEKLARQNNWHFTMSGRTMKDTFIEITSLWLRKFIRDRVQFDSCNIPTALFQRVLEYYDPDRLLSCLKHGPCTDLPQSYAEVRAYFPLTHPKRPIMDILFDKRKDHPEFALTSTPSSPHTILITLRSHGG
ncbi:hypothetical protein GNI_068210 [Gregarina niphandrodes]|uniref:Uncharacterized protein n=1 Tax=Gregarina niphandrodes TaxID=110365 RepID=A0A023B7P3_GRENI|nr:hypothetical protein GNI_068210 [Gregarina niphandrodes]EZG67524.1 hypothetical protein GNI_068210 [Gregarina niphandrodes]|eukprot:XP_011130215.1 hypothetical protein GNI_068210 [Gregarina niphandrodes]